MSGNKLFFVSIVGGFWDLKEQSLDEFKKATEYARLIGSELCKKGFGIVVYFSNEESLEPHVVSGFIESLPDSSKKALIRLRYAESQRDDVKFIEQGTHKQIFDPLLFPGDDWEAPFYRSLAQENDSDALLLVGGGKSAFIAGQIAIARKIPTLAIEKFGGTASIIRKELATHDIKYPAASINDVESLVEWLKAQCEKQDVRRNEIQARLSDYSSRIYSNSQKFWGGLAFFLLLITTFLASSRFASTEIWPVLTYLALVAAGATGALVRSILWGGEQIDTKMSFLLGSIAGFTVGLAYLIPQFIGSYGFLDPDIKIIGAKERIQLLSSLLIAFPAGMGFDTVFSRMRKELEEKKNLLPVER